MKKHLFAIAAVTVIAAACHEKELSSPEFANKLQEIQQINSTINFVIGGSLGFNDKVRTKCKESICFSKMTFPHQLIRVFLLEQIYRAFKINNNETYHK